MRGWIKIATGSVTWYYFRAVCAGGGGVCFLLCMNFKDLKLPGLSSLCQPPGIPAQGSLWERRSPSILGSQGHFCRVFFGRAGASRPSLVEINLVKASLCSASRACPRPQGLGRPYCRILQCSPGQGQLVFSQRRLGRMDAVDGRC